MFYTSKYITAEEGCKSVHLILKRWVSDEVLNQYSMKGVREKRAFGSLENINNSIIKMFELATILKIFDAQLPEKAIQKEMGNYIKHADTRLRAKLRKAEKVVRQEE